MTTKVGIIAEDNSDVEVIAILIRKMAKKSFTVKPLVGHGCGRVRNKCNGWANILKERGCSLLILVHDLDTQQLPNLRMTLEAALGRSPIQRHAIIIPIRELETWLLADHEAIQKTFRFKKRLGKISNPESIPRPKERLRDIVEQRSNGKIIYLNTIHNPKIAQNCESANLSRCASFNPFQQFVQGALR